ncbi:initiator tRNA phosphoribosyl transferase-domain-containing protein [Pyrenochaeta sp. MPI-SDFR-AT-0127]|nr:initiator tRNA phosphoribosyl transferase-domain-containing protein [Pyrenochaeta sp. MPI-SDFR-AT-0127]
MSQPLNEADIIFPHLSNIPSLSSTLSSLRRSTLSIKNRLSSISSDSTFVLSVAEAYNFPLVANERCGSWYIPPHRKSESVYFKSTDGHMGEWGFSLRRLNLQLLDVATKWGGAVIVDSTRRGKSMPDALSKTVPIWCCVINRAIFSNENGKHGLYTPPQAVSESEHAQIEKRIDGFVAQFLDICKPNIQLLRNNLKKPLRPIWITQQSSLPETPLSFPDFHPIIQCTASRRVHGAEISQAGYIQGAADDHEAWSHGLTPTLFWENKDLLMSTREEDIESVIARLITEEKSGDAIATLIKPTANMYVSSSENVDLNSFNVVISCTTTPLPSTNLKSAQIKHYFHLECQTGKLGSRDLRMKLPRLLDLCESLASPLPGKVLVCCPTGKDLSVGTALALLCLYVDEQGNFDVNKRKSSSDIGKAFIKQRLSWITMSNPALNPSRATLQSVNAALLESRAPKSNSQMSVSEPAWESVLAMMEPRLVPQDSKAEHEPDTNDGGIKDGPPDVPFTIFKNLQGLDGQTWTFTRTLCSKLPTHPSGTVIGTATFTPCALPSSSPPTLLYAEEGEFVTDGGLRFTARRKYVYQLKLSREDSNGYVVVHFFNDEKMPRAMAGEGVGAKGEGIGGLFVEMGHVSANEDILEAENREQHLCAEDLYRASWRFSKAMASPLQAGEVWWEVRYDVKGPKKDYMSSTRYSRS